MPNKQYDYLIFIGRFQPFHNGHKKVIDRALELSKNVIVFIGSANSARCYRNPWTFEERKEMIYNSYLLRDLEDDIGYIPTTSRLIFKPLDDVYNDQAWIKQVQELVMDAVLKDANKAHPNVGLVGMADLKIGLIGLNKDHSSYYLNLFPKWDSVDVPQHATFNSTDIRKEYFTSTPRIPRSIIPQSVTELMQIFLDTSMFKNIYDEYQYIENYKKSWNAAPYPPIFVTVDAVVIQSGHVLVVRRKASPGKGLIALPGGFVDHNERIKDAMIRELREETKLKVPEPILRGCIKKERVFDSPNRSSRGRTITHAFLIELESQKDLPKVKGGSDATRADWVPLAELRANEMFEDHYHIIQNMIGEL